MNATAEIVAPVAAGKLALRKLDATTRRRLLLEIAQGLDSARPELAQKNAIDLGLGRAHGLSDALLDRLTLTPARIDGLIHAVESIANSASLVGSVHSPETLANGLRVAKMRVPLGAVAMIYESRPNVTIEAAALCFQSGNACVLRGGKEAAHTNEALIGMVHRALDNVGVTRSAAIFLPPTSRENILELAQLSECIDVLIPRGGEGLIRAVSEHARVPVIKHYKGVCHIFIENSANLESAERIVLNAKVQRPGVCNALETLLLDRALGVRALPILRALLTNKVELRVDDDVYTWLPLEIQKEVRKAEPADWDAEYLDLTLAIRAVDGLDGALAHIEKHGTQHTEAIVSTNKELAERFLAEVDASLVLWNASTRFNDGGELGLGAEMGISTSKIHCYGAMGARELMADKRIAYGQGHIRE